MEPGGRRVGGQEEHIGQVVALREAGGLEVQDGRDQHDAVEGDPLLDEVTGQPRRARGPVALADQEEWRAPALVAAEVEADELAHRFDVALNAPELLAQLRLHRPAVPGPHGVDEDEVGLVEPALIVVDELIGRRRHAAVVEHLHALGADRPQVQPYRGGAGPAVEREHQRPLRRGAGALGGIGHEEDPRLGVAGLALERHRAGRD